MSMLKGKVSFVIPKNKFSGSLVPIFKKPEINDAASEEPNKQQQRKTRWGADLTQDTSVQRVRAKAYQTRVDQITEQLKLGPTRSDYQNSNPTKDAPNELAPKQAKLENDKSLELERRECIGEILKLNPGYKIPSDYEPVLREATVPIPVKAHPDYNFLALVYGSDGETQKRLEKETGTRIQVYGTVTKTGEKVEIIPSDGSEVLRVYEGAYVRISADTYDKVDAAANIIELLLNSVSVKPPESKAIISVSEDGQDTTSTANSSLTSQEIIPPVIGPVSYQQYPNTWFPAGQSSTLSGVTPNPDSGSMQHPSYGLGRPDTQFFGLSPNTSIIPPRLHLPAPILQGMVSEYRVGHTGPLRNLSAQSFTSPLVGNQLSFPRVPAHQLAERSPGWSTSAPPSQYPSPQERPSGTSFIPSQIRSSSSVQFQSFAPHNQQNSSRPSQFPVPGPTFTHFNSAGPHRGSNDFTFNPRLPQGPPSQSLPGESVHFSSQRPSQTQFPPVPQMPSFRPALQSTTQQPLRQSFPRQAVGNQMGPSPVQFGAPNMNPHMGLRNHSPASPFPGALPYRSHVSQFQQSQSRSGGVFRGNQQARPRPQAYDPFLPSSLPAGQPQGIARTQESDPEYEDLMASVGVK